MTLTIAGILFLIALIIFAVATIYAPPRGNLIAAGLTFTAAGLMLMTAGI